MVKKGLKLVSKLINTVLIVALLSTASLVLINVFTEGEPEVFGQELKVVYSGSMEPFIQTGAIIGINTMADKEAMQPGDVVMYQSEPGVFVTHRIVELVETGQGTVYRTKGDNNADVDQQLLLPDNIYGLHGNINIPYVGFAMDFANSQMGLVLLLMIPGVIFLFYSGKMLVEGTREIKAHKKQLEEQKLTSESA
ncbi:signal peptidase I [Paenalkalicoccus suaedae]|uniref:Signal peptidase I n=1 Tax=Paenalkalicoccus suaedae TaxID=2592382 RepID=A0A859FDC2_9BACI|nr:signal peptidase I [Paenalkalicoccus suaedae]QKS70900.1 signal peptidase I [Paenalkalicoccus suaedae]